MRITQRSMYRNFVTNMNSNLSAYMESNIQSASQKRINRPSDDPVGMARVLTYRSSLARTEQYLDNSKDASAYLASTDSALLQASTILATMLEKANQIATETVTTENRLQAASELRQLFGQLLNLANTNFNGYHLFAGQKTESPAYQEGLGITTMDENLQGLPWIINGSADRTIMVRFSTDGVIDPDTAHLDPDDPEYDPGTEITYEYSKDGGKTWITKTLAAGDTTLDLDGVTIKVPANTRVEAYDPDLDTTDENGNITNISRVNGSVLFVRPTAYYMGDDSDPPPLVDSYGTFRTDTTHSVDAYGNFPVDVRIRLDEAATMGAGGKVTYSYSLDNGVTWVTTTADIRADNSNGTLRLQVPGGYLDVNAPVGETLEAGQQFVIRPRRSDRGVEIAEGEFITVTNCGKDIFGGVYTPVGSPGPVPAEGGNRNIFEVLSNLIAWAETGPSDGCGEAVAAVREAIEGLQTSNARVGGKEQRVSLNLTILQSHHDDQTTRMSTIEDADLFELLTRLSQQQLAYQSILRSSSMIMNLSLLNYI
ncbi:MAG: flagellar biosynthesis protein FlgL [Desulfovibrionaceae bacterium]|nr:flagellar biosynthesis protein FlgL [Desulfovibrionaceae bacterium]